MADKKDPVETALCHMAKLHPLRSSEEELLDVLRSAGQGAENAPAIITKMLDDGLLERLKPSASGASSLLMTEKGREYLRAKGIDPAQECITPREIESRLISTYDQMKADMETVRQNLEQNHKTLEEEMDGIRKSMGEHDQFVRTYMVRIVESISMFIGIFAIVVVMMVNVLKDMTKIDDKNMLLYYVGSLPLLLIITIIIGLWLIRKFILQHKTEA